MAATRISSTVRWPAITRANAKYVAKSYDLFSDQTGPADEGWEVDDKMMRSAYALQRAEVVADSPDLLQTAEPASGNALGGPPRALHAGN
jgi:hypothetical protein